MHKVAGQIQDAIDIPLLHIADATGNALTQAGLTRVGLLGTAFTMEHDFYKGRLIQQTNTAVPLFDTTMIHAEAAVDLALEGGR